MFPKKQNWFRRRTALEKALIGVLGVCGSAVLVTGIVIFQNSDSLADPLGSKRSFQDDVCLTPECAVAGVEYKIHLYK